ncbi:MMPL family transporter [Sediminivirga luteola]|uniref:MMPL family transporter n=1 Tax=Sediminivirga luteola TaxID=1774748 RepID=UPI001F5A7BD9|nr:MMPL family transporter [Sediminivirga luteola]MCI2266103.1 MMPL family transporter [Sediminivirga luteola]
MSSFLYRLGRRCFRYRKTVLASWVLVLAIVGAVAGLFSKGFDNTFTLPGSPSQEALDDLNRTFPEVGGGSAQIIVVTAEGDVIDSPSYRDPVEDALEEIEDLAHVEIASNPYGDEAGTTSLSDDDRAAIISVQYDLGTQELPASASEELEAAAAALQEQLPPGAQASPGGELFQMDEVHVSIVEAIGVVVALIVLLFTLGSLRAAGMPLLTALLGVGVSIALITAATLFFTINPTTIMLALMLGLAVGIDYALFIISRHRDQLAAGMDAEESAAQSTATAGSAVVFAGLTVMIALAGLSVAGIPFLSAMGVASAAAVLIAVLIGLTLLPALLGFGGEKLRPRKVREALAAGQPAPEPRPTAASRFFRGWVRAATKIPALTIVVIVVGLGLFAIPAQRLELALPSNATAEEGTPPRVTYDLIDEHFGPGYNGPLIVKADIISSTDPLGDMDDIADELRDLPGVADVPMATPNMNADTGIAQVIPETAPDSPETADLVRTIQDMSAHFEDEYGISTAVTGFTAIGIDVSDRLAGALLPFGAIVVGLSLLLLAMVFRSIWVPLKATLGYLLSVITAFGVVVLVFEDGHGAAALGIDVLGPVISFLPIILMGVLFGLAMDYEVFLVSRMREDYVHGGDARHAIETGFVSSARVVTAAAIIMFSVFGAFVPAGEPVVKAIALGLAVGVFVDAFIVRMTLVPAVMALLGRYAWWLPPWLDRLLPTFDVEGEALARQLALKDWPAPDAPWLVYGEDLGLRLDRGAGYGRGFSSVSLAAAPGEALIVTGSGRRAVLLALSGRLPLDEGRLKVDGYVLPEQAGQLRRVLPHSSLQDLPGTEGRPGLPAAGANELNGLARKIRAGSGPRVTLLDEADTVTGTATRDAAADLAAAALSGGSRTGEDVAPGCLVLGARTPAAASALLPPGTPTRIVDTDEPAARTSGHSDPAAAMEGARR